MKSSRHNTPTIAVIGAGRLARAMIPALLEARYTILTVAATTLASARRASRLAPGAEPKSDAAAAAAPAALVLMAVPDGVITPLARWLAAGRDPLWSDKVVLHHAGALGVEALDPLRRCGAAVGLLHPLQSLGNNPLASSLLRGARARIEGQPKARAAARRIARDLGMVPLRLRAPLSAEQRTIYHAAAAMLSNDLIALLGVGSGLLQTLGLSRRAAIEALVPLARGALLQAERQGLRAALTGPVARGDVETMAAHLQALARRSKGGERIHRLLSEQLLRLVQQEGEGLPQDTRRGLRKLLRSADGGRGRSMKL